MGLFDDVTAADVVSAIDEHDRLGGREFRSRYGFAADPAYLLWHNGRTYDSDAILAVARRFTSGTAATRDQLSGGPSSAARLLAELGFHVTSTDPYGGVGSPATGTWHEASDVGSEAAGAAWAQAARDVLLQAAHRYAAVVTDHDLATQVMYRTGIRTDLPADDWLGDVLARVAADCALRGEPLLPSLCVSGDGGAAAAYAAAVDTATGAPPPHPGEHAAQQRLACYRHFRAAGLPADGGTVRPASRPRSSARAPKAPRATRPTTARPSPPRPTPTCPTCHMALPATGECDTCG